MRPVAWYLAQRSCAQVTSTFSLIAGPVIGRLAVERQLVAEPAGPERPRAGPVQLGDRVGVGRAAQRECQDRGEGDDGSGDADAHGSCLSPGALR
jgi:hypothetical protein